jgi:outer membrane biosynthesis protein TonB
LSLIDEALRRARQEAARQEALKREDGYRHVPVLPPMASRRSSPLRPALIGALVILLVIAGVALGIYLGRGSSPEPESRIAEAPLTPEPERPATVVEPTPEPTPAPTPTPKPVVIPTPTPAPPPLPLPEPTPAPEPTPEPTPTPPPAPEIRTYIREVPLPDGGSLRLNGIAYSATQPVALINDKVLARGESYQGFLVTDIQSNLVELRHDGTIVRVTLK